MVGSESLTGKVIKAWLLGIFKIKLKTMCECAVEGSCCCRGVLLFLFRSWLCERAISVL